MEATDIGFKVKGLWFSVCLLLVVLLLKCDFSEAQQSYVNNHQLACDNWDYNYTTKGYLCNAVQPSCQSYITFRSNPPYTSAATIGYLLSGSEPTRIASLNNISSDVATISTNTQVVVPVNCSCSGDYFQHNASYTLKDTSETYFTVANDTYQELTTCQAMIAQNPYNASNFSIGMTLEVPLRCACPTANQTANGFKYLITYMVTWGDTYSSIASLFNVTQQNVLDANELKVTENIYPFTPLLVPLTSEPTKLQVPVASQPPSQPVEIPVGGPSSSSNSKKWVFVVKQDYKAC